MKVENELEIIEVNGHTTTVPAPKMRVISHWNRSTLVVIAVGDEQYTVSGPELTAAIRNAGNRG